MAAKWYSCPSVMATIPGVVPDTHHWHQRSATQKRPPFRFPTRLPGVGAGREQLRTTALHGTTVEQLSSAVPTQRWSQLQRLPRDQDLHRSVLLVLYLSF